MIKRTAFYGILSIILFTQCKNEPEISQWRGPNRDGIYPETGLLQEWPEEGPELLWEYEELGKGHSSAAVTSKAVYTSGTIDSITSVFSFDHDGNLLWKTKLGYEWMKTYPGVRTTPLIHGEHGYLLTGLGMIHCFDSETGEIIWHRDVFKEFDGVNIMHGITENLLIDGEKIFCTPGGKKSNVIALNRFNGETIWESSGNGHMSSHCSPILVQHNGKKYLINLTGNSVVAINIENGKMAWTYPLNYQWKLHCGTPIYHEGKLFIVDGPEAGNLMLNISDDFTSVTKVWADTIVDDFMTIPIRINDRIYGFASHKKEKWCSYDWETGKRLVVDTSLDIGTLTYADGLLYYYSYNGKLGLLDTSKNKLTLKSYIQIGSKKNDHWAPVVIKDGRLYVRHSNNLYVYNIKG